MDFHRDKVKTEFKVGIFSLVGFLILIISYAWFTEYITNKNYTEIKVRFANAGNIEKGNDVTILGVKRGRVNDIQIDEDSIVLTLRVLMNKHFKENTTFVINEVDLMGDVQVEITPGRSDKLLDLTNIHQGRIKHGMAALFSEMNDVVQDLKTLLTDLTGSEGMLNSTKSIIDTSLSLVTDLKRSFRSNSDNIDLLISKSADMITQLSEIIDSNEENLNRGFESIVDVSNDLKLTLEEFRKTSESVRSLTDKVSNEESTVNRLITEDDLYFTLQRSITRMDSLLQDIEENPKKYFKFSIF
jgi:phospholipid/cholesterol/gamma-HCH transport system substrate-binding protein